MCGLEEFKPGNDHHWPGLEGCERSATQDVENLVLDTLKEIAEAHGVPQDQIDAALHQLELNQREISGDSFPYGLQLILTVPVDRPAPVVTRLDYWTWIQYWMNCAELIKDRDCSFRH